MMLKKEKPLIITISIIILAALLYNICTLNSLSNFNTSSDNKAKKGILDLSNWNFQNEGYTSLSGQWEFYWHQLLTPQDLESGSPTPSYIEMPMAWNKYNKNYNSNGYATYSLTIKLNEKYKGNLLGIRVPPMLSAYKLWVNGQVFSTNGIVGTSSSQELPKTKPITSYFTNNNDKIHLVLQVSNHNFRNGGTNDKMFLGTQSQMANKREASITLEIFYFGVLLIMGLYHLWLYIFRTEDVSKLYFGALCIVISLRTLLVGSKYLLTLHDAFNYSVTLKLEYLTFYAGFYFMINYVYVFFKEECSKIIIKGCKLFSFLFIITTIVIAPVLASQILIIFQIFTLLFTIYITFVILKTYLHKNKKTTLSTLGFLLTLTIGGMSVLHYLGVNNINDYSLLGFFILILLNAFILAMNQSKAYRKIQNLSKEKEQYLLAEKLTKATILLNSTLDLEEVLDKLLKSLKELVPYDSASFFMEDNNRFNVMAANGFEDIDDIYKISIKKEDDKLFMELCETKSTLLVSNVNVDPRFNLFLDKTAIESWMGIPIIFKDKIVGILTLDSKEKNIYTQYHCDIALYFAYHAGMAIENAKLHGKTQHLASTDPLTNLYNRRSFFELASISFDKAKILSQPISGIMMDIDDFKKINDNLGHHTGDLVLKRLSKVCTENLNKNHIFGRYGGEEFVVLLPNTTLEEAEAIGENLRRAIENNPLIIRKSDSIPITLSIGVVSLTPTTEDLDYLFIEADKAMYQAKAQGKNQVVSVNLDQWGQTPG